MHAYKPLIIFITFYCSRLKQGVVLLTQFNIMRQWLLDLIDYPTQYCCFKSIDKLKHALWRAKNLHFKYTGLLWIYLWLQNCSGMKIWWIIEIDFQNKILKFLIFCSTTSDGEELAECHTWLKSNLCSHQKLNESFPLLAANRCRRCSTWTNVFFLYLYMLLQSLECKNRSPGFI